MNNSIAIDKWAEQNFSRPINFQPLSTNKPVVAIAGLILFAIAGVIVWGLLDMSFSQLNKEGTLNWPYLLFAITIVLGCFLLVRLVLKRRKLNIVKMDREGITTVSGAVFKWNDLDRIVFDQAYKKNAVPAEQRCTGIRFYFTNENIYTKYTVPDFQVMLLIAQQLPVKKKDRFSGEYYY
jgi:hypothetical protein